MSLKEIFNSTNPDVVLSPENGWYEISIRNAPPDENLTFAVCYHSDFKSWGYWDSDEWVVIEVPENDPALVRNPVPYSPEEQVIVDQVIKSVRRQLGIRSRDE